MGKRPFREADSGGGKKIKVAEAPSWEDVNTNRQLQQLLTPGQDFKAVRHGLQSFKVLLEAIINGVEGAGSKRDILDQYLESTKPRDDEDTPVFFPDLFEAWSHAAQQNYEPIMSLVAVVLENLLRILSSSLSTLPLALGLGRTLLQKRQQELIAHNLSVDKAKTFVLSPTLRMLREAMCLDGGTLCKPMFRGRQNLFKSLARNMRLKHLGQGTEDAKRPSVRTSAVRFFLSALKFLHPEGKRELLFQSDVVAALTSSITTDPPHVILEILDTLKRHVLHDDTISRDAARRLLNAKTLVHIAMLYGHRSGSSEEDDALIEEAAHDFLMTACTVPSSGVLRQDSGFYPKGLDKEEDSLLVSRHRDMTIEQLGWADKFKTEIPVRNEVLAELVKTLRPWANVKQSELAVAIFRVAPELVAPYFSNISIPFEPKLSAFWIGYAALIFNVTALPLPKYFGWGSNFAPLPPLTSIVLDNILPSPLTQKALSRCFNLKPLTSFFGARILVLALEKLRLALELHRDPHHANQSLWVEASQRLLDAFCQRAPSLVTLINSYRLLPETDLLHRETASRLVRLYYEVIPQIGLLTKFDGTPLIEKAISRLTAGDQEEARDQALSLLELENLLAISIYTTSMRWFSKSESLQVSPFTALLKVYVEAPQGVSLVKLQEVLSFVAEEHQIVPLRANGQSVLPLLQSLQALEASSSGVADDFWSYLDNCFSRCATASVKYREILLEQVAHIKDKEQREDSSGKVMSLITVVFLEQLPFVVKSSETRVLKDVASFLSSFYALSAQNGEDETLLRSVLAKTKATFPKGSSAAALLAATDFHQRHRIELVPDATGPLEAEAPGETDSDRERAMEDDALGEILGASDSLVADNSALLRWASKTADELVDEGYAKAVICLLLSDHESIRKEALTSILKMAAKIQQSEYEEKDQIHLLLCELAETAKNPITTGKTLATPLIAFSCHALDVLRNPLHCLYGKVNQFLTRAPSWDPEKVPMIHEILAEEPDVDSTFYAQVAWLAAMLLDCFATPSDVNIFHRNRAFGPLFERVFSVSNVPYMRQPLKTQLLKVLYRVTQIEGGSSTLTTRFGIVSWLYAQAGTCEEKTHAELYRGLVKRIVRTANDRERLEKWSKGSLGRIDSRTHFAQKPTGRAGVA